MNQRFKVFNIKKSWGNGRRVCQDLDGDLASFESLEELNLVIPETYDNYWMGLTDKSEEGTWVWTDGRKATWTNWVVGDPNDGTNGNCAGVGGNKKLWFDASCTSKRFFVCKFSGMNQCHTLQK